VRPRPTRILPLETSTLKQKCHPDRSAAQWRDLLFIIPFAKPNGCAAPTFVIPTEVEGSAVRPTADPNSPSETSTLKQKCHPDRSAAQGALPEGV